MGCKELKATCKFISATKVLLKKHNFLGVIIHDFKQVFIQIGIMCNIHVCVCVCVSRAHVGVVCKEHNMTQINRIIILRF